MPREGHDFKIIGIASKDINFNPRAPRGARHYAREWANRMFLISIHVPREGHDIYVAGRKITPPKFQSTCPARGTTIVISSARISRQNFNPRAPRGARPDAILQQKHHLRHFNPRAPRGARLVYIIVCDTAYISIHVPREGHDVNAPQAILTYINFNPRAPRGARRRVTMLYSAGRSFQSTCPARGTTLCP